MITQLGLIDYGMGNLHSVQRAFLRLGQTLKIVKKPTDIDKCNALVLPGVGSFDPAMDHLKQTKLIPHIINWANEDRPLLGICLGLQLLFESSDEGTSKGLGILKGNIEHLPENQNERIPNMGWSLLKSQSDCPIFKNHHLNNWVYFVHSYAAIPSERKNLAATIKFGSHEITAIVWEKNIGACQFHPEKSGTAGQMMLDRWLKWLVNNDKLKE